MIKKIGVLLVTVLGGVLLIYSASRSLDFIGMTLPADKQALAYFGLAALDGGLIAWLLSYLYGARGGWQRAISMILIIVDAIGAIAMFTMDTLYQTGKNGLTKSMSSDEITTAVLGLSGIIALNIIATVAHHITDPDKLREQAEEEAFAKVEEATLKQISKNAESLAAQLAPVMAADWQAQTRAKYLSYVGTGELPVIDVTSQNMPTANQSMNQSMPILAQAPTQNKGIDWASLFGWAIPKSTPRSYQSATVAPTVKPNDDWVSASFEEFKKAVKAETATVAPEAKTEEVKDNGVFTDGVAGKQ